MLNNVDTLIYGRATFNTMDSAREVLGHMLTGGPFTPQYWGAVPPVRNQFDEEQLDDAARLLVNQAGQNLAPDMASGDIFLERRKKPKVQHYVKWKRGSLNPFSKSSYSVSADYLRQERRLSEWLSFMLPLLEIHESYFGALCMYDEWEDHNVLRYKTRRLPDWPDGYDRMHGAGTELQDGVPGVYWGTYFGPFYVDWFGREKFDDLPAVDKQELPGGGIFFTTADTPFEWNTPDTQARQEAIKQQLGADAFFDIQALRTKMAEMAEPFPEGFDPLSLAPKRWVPEFPFADEMKPREKSREEEIAEARTFFESQGFVFRGLDGDVLVFDGEDGSRMQIDLSSKLIDHFPEE